MDSGIRRSELIIWVPTILKNYSVNSKTVITSEYFHES